MPTIRKPRKGNYATYSQFETACRDYANSKSKAGVLEFTAAFNDGSVFTDTIERERKEISFPYYDGETIEFEYNTHRFIDMVYTYGDPYTLAQTKRAITEGLNNMVGVKVESITFNIIED